MEVTNLIEDYLFLWILGSVSLGLLFPQIRVLEPFSTVILAVMIGSISLTLSVENFREMRPRSLIGILVVQTSMPFVAYAVARLLSLSPELTVGFVLLGAVTPELVTPVMTELAGGDTALATTTVVVVGMATVFLVPGTLTVLLGKTVAFDPVLIVEGLLLAVVLPMLLAISLRHRWTERVSTYDTYYPSVSALMVILIIGVVTASNVSNITGNTSVLVVVGAGAVALNLTGYGLGWSSSSLLGFDPDERTAATFSVGMRDFAVAAALVVSAGFPPIASLPAVVFGIFEMLSSAVLARYFSQGGRRFTRR
ncbi:MAG: bile acid:sodium symporter [Halobacteria archaeon]|nr:bile acid:sodium symporter [Halobacteria archaeon]